MINRKTNVGISIGRLMLCFLVVMCHFGGGSNFAGYVRRLAVPAFTFIAFYLTWGMFYNRDCYKIRQRMIRLLIPYISWGTLYYAGVSCLRGTVMPASSLIWQLISGASQELNPTLWFLLAQMLYVLILSLIFLLAGSLRQANLAVIMLLILCLLLQYSGLSVELFWEWRIELKYTTGFTLEVFPYAILGSMLGWADQEIKISKNIVWIVCCIGFSAGLFLPEYLTEGFGYYGVKMLICGVMLSGIFIFFPFALKKIASFINRVAKYSLGAYCLHLGVGRILQGILTETYEKKIPSVLFCFIIYICSFVIAFLIGKIPSKFAKKMVS